MPEVPRQDAGSGRSVPAGGLPETRSGVSDRRRVTSLLRDAGYPGYAMGAAAEAIGVTPGFLRALGKAGLFEPHRSAGGHRRYSRTDLEQAARARELVDEGTPVSAAVRIVRLEYQLAAARAALELLRRRHGESSDGVGPPAE